MKKKFLFGMIALLSASLVFMSCPDEADPEKSADKAITQVLGVNVVPVDGDTNDGSTAATAKAYTVTLSPDATATAVKVANITVSAKATKKLYSDAVFETEPAEATGITLAAAGTALNVYIKVTAENGTAAYYKVSITKLDTGLSTVLDETITATGDGTAASPKTATITVAAATTAGTIGLSGIVASDTDASVKLYSDSGFSTEVTGESTITLILGGTKIVYILVTAEDDTTKTYYAVSIEKPQDVLTAYSLKASEAAEAAAAASGITLASAEKLNGVVTLKLGGTVGTAYKLTAPGTGDAPYTAGDNFQPEENYWVDAHDAPTPGVYAAVYIHGILSATGLASKVLAVKHTNQALRFYEGERDDPIDVGGNKILSATPDRPKITDGSNTQTIYIPANPDDKSEPIRWKLYQAGSIVTGGTFGILIWNGGTGTTYSPKTATLEIAEYSAYTAEATKSADIAKVIVDYSDVTW